MHNSTMSERLKAGLVLMLAWAGLLVVAAIIVMVKGHFKEAAGSFIDYNRYVQSHVDRLWAAPWFSYRSDYQTQIGGTYNSKTNQWIIHWNTGASSTYGYNPVPRLYWVIDANGMPRLVER